MKLWLLVALLAIPALLCSGQVRAAEDELDEDEEKIPAPDVPVVDDYSDLIDEDLDSTKSPDADVYMLFTKPAHSSGFQYEFPAGETVEFLVGFANKGEGAFVVDNVEASFRYPQDFNYYIQNFSALAYNREVLSGSEATVIYSFVPSDSFAGRPFGLHVAFNYHDRDTGAIFSESIFNETVHITEVDAGLDGETFFLYIFLGGVVVLMLVLGQQFLVGSVGKRKRAPAQRKVIETGTNGAGASSSEVDYEWLPEETLKAMQRNSPKASPKSRSNGPSPKKVVAKPLSPKTRPAKA